MFWQLTIDACHPEQLAAFWADALGYVAQPPREPDTTWWAHYRDRAGAAGTFDTRLFSPDGSGPAIWFQPVPEDKSGKNRIHLDLYPTGRDNSMSMASRCEVVDAKVQHLVALGAEVVSRTREDDPEDPIYFVTMHDPEGNEFCVS